MRRRNFKTSIFLAISLECSSRWIRAGRRRQARCTVSCLPRLQASHNKRSPRSGRLACTILKLQCPHIHARYHQSRRPSLCRARYHQSRCPSIRHARYHQSRHPSPYHARCRQSRRPTLCRFLPRETLPGRHGTAGALPNNTQESVNHPLLKMTKTRIMRKSVIAPRSVRGLLGPVIAATDGQDAVLFAVAAAVRHFPHADYSLGLLSFMPGPGSRDQPGRSCHAESVGDI